LGTVTESNPYTPGNWVEQNFRSEKPSREQYEQHWPSELVGGVVDEASTELMQEVSKLQKPRDLFSEPLDIPPFLSEPVEFKKIEPKRHYERSPQLDLPITGKIDWKNPERLSELRSLMRSRLSVVDVARRMGCSRNAIIGACHRNEIPISIREK
jgi:hypothetical protein